MPPISCTSKCRWPSTRLAASRTVAKAGHQQFVKTFAVGDFGFELIRAGAQGVVGKRRDLRLQRVYRQHFRGVGLQSAIVGAAEDFFCEATEHSNDLSGRRRASPDKICTPLPPPISALYVVSGRINGKVGSPHRRPRTKPVDFGIAAKRAAAVTKPEICEKTGEIAGREIEAGLGLVNQNTPRRDKASCRRCYGLTVRASSFRRRRSRRRTNNP